MFSIFIWFRKALLLIFQELSDDYKVYRDIVIWLDSWKEYGLSKFIKELWKLLWCWEKLEDLLKNIYGSTDNIPRFMIECKKKT